MGKNTDPTVPDTPLARKHASRGPAPPDVAYAGFRRIGKIEPRSGPHRPSPRSKPRPHAYPTEQGSSRMPDPSPPGPPGADILMVDDRPANLLALEAVLDGVGDRLVRAASGEEALALLAGRDVAVVLLDVQMPGLNGFETAKRFRALDRSRHTPIIFLSAAESDEFPVAEAYRLGAVDYLLKPLVPEILRAKVAVFVELFRRGERVRELERREGEERLRVALDAGQTGVWEWDIVTGKITWSDRVAGFYGMAPASSTARSRRSPATCTRTTPGAHRRRSGRASSGTSPTASSTASSGRTATSGGSTRPAAWSVTRPGGRCGCTGRRST